MKPLALAVTLLLSFVSPFTYAQLTSSEDILKKAAALFESGKTDEGARLALDIPPGDSNHARAIYNVANAYYADSQYQDALRYCKQGIETPSGIRHYFLNLEGNIYDDMDKPEEAMAAYRRAIAQYPNYVHPYTNLALVMLKRGLHDSAEALMQRAVLAFPYSHIAHFRLGSAAYRQGKIIQAFLAYSTSLMVEPDGQFYRSALENLDKLSRGNEEFLAPFNNRTYSPDGNYTTVEEIFTSRLALDKAYKINASLTEPLLRQLYMIVDKLEFSNENPDFYVQVYLPMYRQVIADKQVNPLFYHLLSGIEVADITNYIKDNKKDLDRFKSSCSEYLSLLRTTREISYAQRQRQPPMYHYENGACIAKGKLENDKRVGPWEYYYPLGQRKGIGQYGQPNKQEGSWQFFYPDGTLSATERYRDGLLEGEARTFHERGVPNMTATYRAGKKNGKSVEHHPVGTVSLETSYLDGVEDGPYKTYHSNGQLNLDINTKNGKGDGSFTRYYENGHVQVKGFIRDGNQAGKFRYFHENGMLDAEGEIVNDLREGQWKSYHENGTLKTVETYSKGQLTGERTNYHSNGKLQSREMYTKDGLEGDIEVFTNEGHKFAVLTYRSGQLTNAVYYNRKGEPVSTSTAKGKQIDLDVYTPDGVLARKTRYDAKGKRYGKETSYHGSGKIDTEGTYEDDQLQGKSQSFGKNGKLLYDVNYVDDKKNGLYSAYYPHGVLEKTGYMEDNTPVGNWLYFSEDGLLVNRISHVKDEPLYFEENFYRNGKREMLTRYRNEVMDSLVQFDTTGKVLHINSMPNGEGPVKIMQINGKLFSSYTLRHGRIEGAYTSYFPNGKVQTKSFYKKGMLDSAWTQLSPDGKVVREGRYVNGEKDGVWKSYNDNGVLVSTEEYKYGKLNGKITYYYPNGKIDRETPYVNGVKEGWSSRYAETGDLMYTIQYQDEDVLAYTYLDNAGKLLPPIYLPGGTGKLKALYSNGKPSAEVAFESSVYVGPHRNWHPNGTLVYESMESYDLTQGPIKTWYPDGKPKTVTPFWENMMLGAFKEYHPNGTVKTEGEYVMDSKHGTWKYYQADGKLLRTELYYHGRLLEIK